MDQVGVSEKDEAVVARTNTHPQQKPLVQRKILGVFYSDLKCIL